MYSISSHGCFLAGGRPRVVFIVEKTIPAHWDSFTKRKGDEHDLKLFYGDHGLDYCNLLVSNSQAYTGRLENGEVVVIAGVANYWPGVGTAWLFASDLLYKYPKGVSSSIKRLLTTIMIEEGYHRVQTPVKANNEIANRFIKWLGFNAEGLMKGYGVDKSDYILYGRCI